jgi:hypothetical protein
VTSKSLEEWLKILWENEFEYVVWCVPSLFVFPSVFVPRGWGLASPFIGQGGGELHVRRAIQLRGGARRATL